MSVVVVIVIVVVVAAGRGSGLPKLPAAGTAHSVDTGNLVGYDPSRAADYAARATAGEAYALFAKSPGGVVATAGRVASYRPLVDRASTGSGVDPNLLEGILCLESGGRSNVIAGNDPADASGLTQILAATGTSLLRMHIDLAASRQLTGRIVVAELHGQTALVGRLQRQRARIDDRFNPRLELAATIRYLQLAQQQFGRQDLSVVSYHMGIANLGNVLDQYSGGRPVPYVQLFFDTAPDRHLGAYKLLSGFGDDSWLYYWRVQGAMQIMRLYRTDRPALVRLSALETAGDSDAAVLQPPDRTPPFASPDQLATAYIHHQVVRLPSNATELGLAYDPGMGGDAHQVGAPVTLYRGLRPDALTLLIALATRVRELSGVHAPLTVLSSVTDQRYQRQLGVSNPQGTTGYAFQIARRYASGGQAAAFQAVLDRLQALNLIAWAAEPGVIDITVASDAARYLAAG